MSNTVQSDPPKPVSTTRKVFAALLDFIFVMAIGGYLIGYLTGNVSDEGFELKGAPALSVVLPAMLSSPAASELLWPSCKVLPPLTVVPKPEAAAGP